MTSVVVNRDKQNRTAVMMPAQMTMRSRDGIAPWRRRLGMGLAVLVLAGATVLALKAAGPEARSLIASEGTVFSHPGPDMGGALSR